jgi:hypothetical protein
MKLSPIQRTRIIGELTSGCEWSFPLEKMGVTDKALLSSIALEHILRRERERRNKYPMLWFCCFCLC